MQRLSPRWQSVGTVVIVLAVVLGAWMVFAGSDGGPVNESGGAEAAAEPPIVPWADRTPAPGDAPAACEPGDLSVSLGRTGAWHGQSTQGIDIVNRGDTDCTLSTKQIAVSLHLPRGDEAVPIDDGVATRPLQLMPDQSAFLTIGSPATCGPPSDAIVRQVSVSTGEGKVVELVDAYVPLTCGDASITSLDVVPVEPETEKIDLAAVISAPSEVPAGSILEFSVQLRNESSEPIRFDTCPEYIMGLKRAMSSGRYVLNCDTSASIAPGDSQTYAMRFQVPASAGGSDLLGWSLLGYPADDSVDIVVTQ